jgi:AraC-like DNA-binding protein
MTALITVLLVSGILHGLFLIFLLYKKDLNKTPNRILAALIFAFTFHLGLIALDVRDLFLVYPHLSRLSWLTPLLYGPLILLLTRSLIEIRFSVKVSDLIYLIPFAIYLIILFPYFTSGANEKVAVLSDSVRVTEADFGWMNHLTSYFHILFVSYALFLFYQNRKKRGEYFSDETQINIRWLEEFLWCVLAIMIFSALTFYSKKYDIPYLSAIYPAHFILAVALIYWIGYKLLQEKTHFSTNTAAGIITKETGTLTSPPKYLKSGLQSELTTILREQISELMDREKPFLNPDLNISELAIMVSLSRHQLSQVINSALGCNFFEFVNQYRVREFKVQVTNSANSHLSLLGIAFECGFNSKATFNQVFKKYEGITPSVYLKKQKLKAAGECVAQKVTSA